MVIVDSHHKALISWAEYRSTLRHAPRLITLDHHTDTSKPFRNCIHSVYGANYSQSEQIRAQWLSSIDFSNLKSVSEAIMKLSNDEHIVAAIESNIVSSAFVIAHNAQDTDLDTYEAHKIMCWSVDRDRHLKKVSRQICDRVLEADFLNVAIQHFNHLLGRKNEPLLTNADYILDIDLDYLNTFKSVAPIDSSVIKQLALNAGLITIATEPEYVKNCALDPQLSSETLLPALLQLLERT